MSTLRFRVRQGTIFPAGTTLHGSLSSKGAIIVGPGTIIYVGPDAPASVLNVAKMQYGVEVSSSSDLYTDDEKAPFVNAVTELQEHLIRHMTDEGFDFPFARTEVAAPAPEVTHADVEPEVGAEVTEVPDGA